MKRTLMILTLCSAIAVAAFAQGGQQKPATDSKPALPTADQILDKYVQAIGGKAAIEKQTSRVSKGSFEIPAVGASGTFGDSGLSLTVQTDSRGMAVGRGLKPNRIAGPFRIRVTSSWQGEAASASLTQTNAEPLTKSSNSKWIAIVALAGGAVAGGAVAATRGGKSQESAGTSAASTIVAGNPSLGPPH